MLRNSDIAVPKHRFSAFAEFVDLVLIVRVVGSSLSEWAIEIFVGLTGQQVKSALTVLGVAPGQCREMGRAQIAKSRQQLQTLDVLRL